MDHRPDASTAAPSEPSATAPAPETSRGLLDAAVMDEARELLDAGLAAGRTTLKLAALEWQLCKAGWARLLWLIPLAVVLALSVWASLLVGLFSLVLALSGGAVLLAWLSVVGAQLLALVLTSWKIQKTLQLSRFARTRAAFAGRPAEGASHAA